MDALAQGIVQCPLTPNFPSFRELSAVPPLKSNPDIPDPPTKPTFKRTSAFPETSRTFSVRSWAFEGSFKKASLIECSAFKVVTSPRTS